MFRINTAGMIIALSLTAVVICRFLDTGKYTFFPRVGYIYALMFLALGLNNIFIIYRSLASENKGEPVLFWFRIFGVFAVAVLFIFFGIKVLAMKL